MNPEYRKAIRRCPNTPLDVIDSMTEALAGKLLDISTSGLKILTPSPMRVNALFQWRLPIPDTPRADIIECGIQIVWINANTPEGYTVGARFIQIPPQARERLRHWCNAAPA